MPPNAGPGSSPRRRRAESPPSDAPPSSPRRASGASPARAKAVASAKPAASGPRAAVRRALPGGGPPRWTGRALGVAVLLLAFFVGLPVAHAVLGELGALALALGLGAFALGRVTSPWRQGRRGRA